MRNHIVENKNENIQGVLELSELINYQYRIEPAKYFIAINGDFPEVIAFYENIESETLLIKTLGKFTLAKNKIWKYKEFNKNEGKIVLVGIFIEITQDIFLFCDSDDEEVKILYSHQSDTKIIEQLVEIIKSCLPKTTAQSKIFLLYETPDNRGFQLKDFKVEKFSMSLEDNYNADFPDIHQLMLKRLNQKEDKGLILLHGTPGTGKTTYIRYLTSLVNKKMIYIAPEFAYRIASPSFLPFLIDNPNSVLIIEDAENIIESRDVGRSISVSNLLNVADGLLSDCLNIQLICTFNTHISKVDQALLRKGRLIASYEFKPLSIDKAQSLSDKIGFTNSIHKPMTLADIYNQDAIKFENRENKKVGF